MRLKKIGWLMLLFIGLITLPIPSHAVEFGVGLPDMIEGHVDELDEKVREFKEEQTNFTRFEPATLLRPDTDAVISGSAIAPLDNRVYIAVKNPSDNNEQVLFLLDGGGNVAQTVFLRGSTDFSDEKSDTLHQVSFSPDENVDVLTSVETANGPTGLFIRNQAQDLERVGAFAVGNTGDTLFETNNQSDTVVAVNTFAYDENGCNGTGCLYISGDSGVFSVNSEALNILRTGTEETDPLARWDFRFQGRFSVPEDNLVTRGDSIYATDLTDTAFRLVAFNRDTATEATVKPLLSGRPSGNPKDASLVIGNKSLFLHYTEKLPGDTNTVFAIDLQDLSINQSASFMSTSQLEISLRGQSKIFGSSQNGDVFSFDASPLSSLPGSLNSLKVSTAKPQVVAQGDGREIYVGTKVKAQGNAFAVSEDLSDSTALLSDTQTVAPINKELFTRPFFSREGFVGVSFGGSSVGWWDGMTTPRPDFFAPSSMPAFSSNNLRNSSWPHEDGDNQRQRQQQ